MPLQTQFTDPASLVCEWLWIYDGLVPVIETWSKEIVVPPGVFFVLEGMGKVRVEGRELKLLPGTAFFSAPGTRQQWFAAGTRLLSVGFRALWPDGTPLFTQGLNCSLPAANLGSLHTATRRLYRTLHGSRRSVTYREATKASCPELLDWCQHEAAFRTWFAVYVKTLDKLGIRPTERQRPADARINEIMRRLNAWPLARPLIVDEIANGLNIGHRRLEQLLAEELGLTPHSHLNRRRMEAARHLLAGTKTPLKQIAHELGLRHASHFTKWFRLHAGMPPSQFRDGGTGEAA